MSHPDMQFIKGSDTLVLDKDVEAFLRALNGPTLLHLKGERSDETRAISTLLHGNEPSGINALFRYLQEGHVPKTNVLCFIGSVSAALTPPFFTHRMLPGHTDLNRCFKPPFNGQEGKIAKQFIDALREFKPISLIDIHNTSGFGPSFGITLSLSNLAKTLCGLFCPRLIYSKIELGSLMEAQIGPTQIITVESGGASDPKANEQAYQGLLAYFSRSELIYDASIPYPVSVLVHPIRIELKKEASIEFNQQHTVADLCLLPDIERHNLHVVAPDTTIGYLGSKELSVLLARDEVNHTPIDELFYSIEGKLITKVPLHFFMITTNQVIAQCDCLFYVVKARKDDGSPTK